MIFDTGFVKKYGTLRDKKPSVNYLEEMYYKVLQLNIDKEYKMYLNDSILEEDEIITVHFPEYLDVTTNLNLIKSIHFDFDISLNAPKGLTYEVASDPVNIVHPGDDINSKLVEPVSILAGRNFREYPEGLVKLYFGYRYVAVIDPNRHLGDADSLCCKQLVEMEDTCFNWIEVSNRHNLQQITEKTTVCKFKVEIDTKIMKEWLDETLTPKKLPHLIKGMKQSDSVDFNFILHPPYLSRMSFKDNLKIVYPLPTSRVKLIDRISFRTNKSFTVNNKLYTIQFIDKKNHQILFKFDSVNNADLFEGILKKVDTRAVNSYFDEEVETFKDSNVVTLQVPVPVQISLSKHNNYKIKILARDLTTQERG